MSDTSILKQTVRGAGWTVAWRVATRLIGTVNTVILARLLLPGDFGLVALATGFAQTILAFSSLGVAEAVMREHAPSRDLYDTAFTVNLLRGAALALAIALAVWPVAAFFNDARLAPVLLALGACHFVSSCENIGTLEYFRDFAFDKEFRLRLIPRLAGVVATIGCALIWRNHWALVAGIATGHVLGTAMGYAMHPYRPRLTLCAWRQIAGFSFWSWAIAVAIMIRDRIDGFVVGRYMGMTQVGIYTLGGEIATMATYELAAPVGRACYAGFAAESRAGAASSASYLRILASVTVVVLPVGVGVSLVAEPLIALLFGEKWMEAVAVARVMGVAAIAAALSTIPATLLQVHAALRPIFMAVAVAFLIRAIGSLASIGSWGLTGAAMAQAVAYRVEYGMLLAVVFRRFDGRPTDLLALVWRSLLATGAMAAVLLAAGLADGSGRPIRELAQAVSAGGAVYTIALLGAWLACGRPAGAEADLLTLARAGLIRLPVAGSFARRFFSGDGF